MVILSTGSVRVADQVELVLANGSGPDVYARGGKKREKAPEARILIQIQKYEVDVDFLLFPLALLPALFPLSPPPVFFTRARATSFIRHHFPLLAAPFVNNLHSSSR